MGNSRWSGSLISGGGIYAAGTTYFNTQAGSAATVLTDGSIKAASSLIAGSYVDATTYVNAGSYVESTTYVKAGTGYVTGKGDTKQFACGTYYGIGGATAPITATGLTTIHHVFLQRRRNNYNAGTGGVIIGAPAIAASTLGSFYPLAFKAQAAGGLVINGTAATMSWFALGAKTI